MACRGWDLERVHGIDSRWGGAKDEEDDEISGGAEVGARAWE
jgi:hypothetical protein